RKNYPGVNTLPAHEDPSTLGARYHGDRPTVVIDATGNRESMQKCFEYVAHGGTIVYVGLFIGDVGFPDPLFHAKEITLKSSRAALPEDFRKIIRLLRSGHIRVEHLVTTRIPYDAVAETFPRLYDPS